MKVRIYSLIPNHTHNENSVELRHTGEFLAEVEGTLSNNSLMFTFDFMACSVHYTNETYILFRQSLILVIT